MTSNVETEVGGSPRPRPSRLMRVLRNLLPPLFGILIALICIEICFRLFLSLAPTRRWSDRPKFFYNPPTATTLQDYPYPASKAPNTFRISVVGDSFTFGPHLQFDDTFPKRLERILSMNEGPLKAEVINHGTAGYSTQDEVQVATCAAQDGADLIILEITLNDPELQIFRPKGGNGARFGPLKITKKDTPLLYYWKSLGFVAQRIHAEKTRTAYRQYFFDLFEKPETWDVFKRSVEDIAKLREKYPTRIAAVIFPLISFGFDDSYPFTAIHQKVAGLMQSLNVPLLDLFSSYRNIPSERLQVIPNEDPHPNEIAHRIAAEKIYTWLLEQHLLPDSLRVKHAFWTRDNKQMFSRFTCEKRPKACFGTVEEARVEANAQPPSRAP